ncbi:MAG: iron-containing alcohol dehydrogenase [Deltaproteobacteria bacterium]|nr:iron-containing alcohol dehydrogenase [Deltaproteobacteria bacterium]
MYQVVLPRILCMGIGSLQSIEKIIQQRDPKRILIVTGPNVQRLGILEKALKAMGGYARRVDIFINPTPEPGVAIMEECAKVIREKGFDLIVGLGGGSPMDLAKGAAAVAVHGGKMRPLLGRNLLKRNGIPTILIPTTAGSGTETTQAIVVSVPEEETKKSIWDPRTVPEAAIVDPELSRQMSPQLTAETGLDALVHAVEGHTSCFANPITRMYTGEATRLIAKYLIRAYCDGSDMEAREAMARAATLAGIGMTNSGLGAIHALALVFDHKGFTHCQSLAVLAPWVLRFNCPGHEEIYAEVAEALGEKVQGLSPEQAARKASDAILRIQEAMNVSPYLRDYGIKKEELPSLALKAHEVGQRLLHMNIKEVQPEDAVAIFQEAFSPESK